MKKRYRLPQPDEANIVCQSPMSDDVIAERDKGYYTLSDVEFRRNYRKYVFEPAIIRFPNEKVEIQMNFCNDPFCGWYGQNQKRYENVKSKPSRYKLVGGTPTKGDEPRLYCNEIPSLTTPKPIINNTTITMSNWALAEEVKRLINFNGVVVENPIYVFHKGECKNSNKTPFDNRYNFHKRGKSVSNSTRYQCLECKKITNVLPGQEENFNYHQKRNDILIQLCSLLFSRTPIKRICEVLDIGAPTFYSKLEWIYKKCVEFNMRYEIKALSEKQFNELWINTDLMIYNLNNVRLKGKGGDKSPGTIEKKPVTYIVSSADMITGYAFRSDVAYDSEITLEKVEEDTKKYHCDHSYHFLRKNERLKYSYCPMPPTKADTQSQLDYLLELADFNNRKDYVEGCHTKPQYTSMAHYLLLLMQLNANQWYFISDDDRMIQNCIFKVFTEKFREDKAVYFTCQNEKGLSLEESGKMALQSRSKLQSWGKSQRVKVKGVWNLAKSKLQSDLNTHDFYDYKTISGVRHPIRGSNPIEHPLPDKDEGIRWVNLISHSEQLADEELAELIIQVNSRAINNYFQEVRRRISVLERPLVTARGDGKSYIYANYNPKYAQQLLTIFRTFYNFCWKRKYGKEYMTPAQRLGITDKVYEYKDIVNFR